MLSSAEAEGGAVVTTILALERSCLDAEAALVERRADDIDAALRVQAELTVRLAELFAQRPEQSPLNDARVAMRLRGVLAYREDQLRRLCAYRDEVQRRLGAVGKVRALARSVGRSARDAAFLDTQQ